jgi:hypothetical protein
VELANGLAVAEGEMMNKLEGIAAHFAGVFSPPRTGRQQDMLEATGLKALTVMFVGGLACLVTITSP